jgi:hypothetical protein
MNRKLTICGVAVLLAIMGLSLGNALTGYSIKGNKDLNVAVLGDGSSGSSECTSSWPGDCIQTGNRIYSPTEDWREVNYSNPKTVEGMTCWDVERWGVIKCGSCSSECTSGGLVHDTYPICNHRY